MRSGEIPGLHFAGPDTFQGAAIAARKNSVISAGAGSGKTFVLAARYLSMVAEDGLDPESILVLTFTRKAQGEMYERIYQALANESRAKSALSAFSESRISTIDSFCAEIARSGACAYGLSSDFSVDDDARLEAAERAALLFVLDQRDSLPLRELIAAEDFTRVFRGFFAEFAATRLSLIRKVDFEGGFARQKEAVRKNIVDARVKASESADILLELKCASPALALVVKQAAAFLKSIPESRDAESAATALESCAVCAKAISLRSGSKTCADDIRAKEILAGIRDSFLPSFGRNLSFLMDESRALAILSLLEKFSLSFLDSVRETGILTFRETAELALASLRDDLAIRNHYKSRIKAIMVDEFQDNDPLQKDLLYYIAECHSRSDSSPPCPSDLRDDALFFVGDAKQSIYRFRGADVSVFMKLKDELSSVWGSGSFVELKGNYRSERRLVHFLNTVFGRVFSGGEGASSLDPEYSGQVPQADTDGAVSGAAVIQVSKRGNGDEYRSPSESEAWRIAEWIKARMADESFLIPKKSGDGSRIAVRPEWSDFAVLLRVTTHQHEIETAFRKNGIPYHALNVCALYTEAPVNDMAEALKLCVYPDDLLAFAAFLRSPFVMMSDDGFASAVLAARESGTAWPEAAFALDSDEKKYEAGRRLIGRISILAASEGTASAVSRLWFAEGYRLAILASGKAESLLSYYDYFFETALEADRKGLPLIEFVDSLREKLGNSEKLDGIEPPEERPFGVKVMTIHKSKGLEFPVVVIPFLKSTAKPEANAGVLYWSETYGPVFNLSRGKDGKRQNPFWEAENELERARTRAELKRLFYVACTRAESFLVFSWSEPEGDEKESGEKEPDERETARKTVSMHEFLGGALDSRFDPEALPEILERDFVTRDEWFGNDGIELPIPPAGFYSNAKQPREFGPEEFTVTELVAFAASESVQAGKGGTPFIHESLEDKTGEGGMEPALFGTLVHAVIEQWIKNPGMEFVLPDMLASVSGNAEAVGSAKALAMVFFDSEYGRKALEHPDRAESEVPFLLRVGSGTERVFLRGTIDFLYRDDEGPVVMDFKTNRGETGSSYDVQLEAYRRAAEALENKSAKVGLFMLREGKFSLFKESPDLETLCARYAESRKTRPSISSLPE